MVVLAATAGFPVVAAGTTADDLCKSTEDPCRVSGVVTVTPGSTIDCGNRELLVQPGGSLSVGSGSMTLVARDVTIQNGGALRAAGSTTNDGGSIIIIADTMSIAGGVDVSGAAGGTLTVTTTGDLAVSGTINANSRQVGEDGGTITLTALNVTLAGTVSSRGSRDGTGGEIDISAGGDLAISGSVSATGPDGGTISLDVGADGAGDLIVTRTGEVVADSTGADGSGDFLDVEISGDGVQNGNLAVDGDISLSAPNGGSAGFMEIEAAGRITLSDTARVSATGRFGGDGGDIALTSDDSDIDVRGTLDSSSSGTGGQAGDICLCAGGGASVGGSVDARGGRDGGDIDIDVGSDVGIGGTLRTQGSSPGRGGQTTVRGCTVSLGTNATLSSLGPNSLNRLTGKTVAIVNGTMRADETTGHNVIVFGQQMPIISASATIIPAVERTPDTSLVPCGLLPTPTPTVTPTPSPTATPAPCLGDCNGDGLVSTSELVTAVSIALDQLPLAQCPAFGGAFVNVADIVTAVNNALHGCP